MSDENLLLISKKILLQIHVITGWVVPSDNARMNVLVDQFTKILREKYSEFNALEFEYAFRNHSSGIKDWGKSLNLHLIDEVMIEYASKRFEISQMEESKAKELPAPVESLNDKTMQDWMADLKSKKLSVDFMPIQMYDWLEKGGILNLPKEKKWEYMRKAIAVTKARLSEAAITNADARKDFAEIERGEKAKIIPGKFVEPIRNLSRKMILFDYLYGK